MQERNRIDLLGLLLGDKGRVIVTQRNFVAELMTKAEVSKFAATPSRSDLFEPRWIHLLWSTQILDQYMSLNQSYAFAAARTYPECLPYAAVYASRFVVATEEDFQRLRRSISYLGHDPNHCLMLHPGSLSLVASAMVNLTPGFAWVSRDATECNIFSSYSPVESSPS